MVGYLYCTVFVLYSYLIIFDWKSEGPFCHNRFSGDHTDANVTGNLDVLAVCSGFGLQEISDEFQLAQMQTQICSEIGKNSMWYLEDKSLPHRDNWKYC